MCIRCVPGRVGITTPVVADGGVVLDQGDPSGSTVDTGLDTIASRYGLCLLLLEVFHTPGIDDICLQVQRQLMRNESAQFYHDRLRKCLPQENYAERYSRFKYLSLP